MDQNVTVDQPANDLFAMGQSVSVDAIVGDNAFVMAQNLDVTQPVNGDLYAMGQVVTIDAEVSGDVYAMGAQVVVTPNGKVGGDLRGGAEALFILGPVAGDLDAGAGLIRLEAPVGGDADLEFGEVLIAGQGAIAGDLDYASVAQSSALESVAAGEVQWTEQVVEVQTEEGTVVVESEEESSLLAETVWWSGMRFWGFLTKFMVGAVILALGGDRVAAIGRRITTHPGQSLGVGFVAAALLPVASTLALATVIPFPLGLLGFAVFGIALYVAQLFAAQAIGDLVLRRFRPGAIGNPILSLAVGLGPLVLLCAIPWLGNLAFFGATFLGMGAMWAAVRGQA